MSTYLTLADAVEIVPVAQITLRRAIKRGDLTAYRIGGKLLIRPDDLDRWIQAHREPAPMPRPKRTTAGAATLLDNALQKALDKQEAA